MKHFLHLDRASWLEALFRYADETVYVTNLRLLFRSEGGTQKKRAFIVYGIGLEGFDNRARCMSERFQCCV